MKNWFPLTDYDFYAYLTCGGIVLCSFDYCFIGSLIIESTYWPVTKIIFVISIAYIIGHVIAGLASLTIEYGIVGNFIAKPLDVLMRFSDRTKSERAIGYIFAQREYAPLPNEIVNKAKSNAYERLSLKSESDLTSEGLFYVAYSLARDKEDTKDRLDQFRNLYGFCRNASFSFIVATVFLTFKMLRDPTSTVDGPILFLCIILCVGMFGRFLKFYAAFTSEVLRAIATSLPDLPDTVSK